MSVFRYPPETLTGDYTRAGLGLLLTVVPLLVVQPTLLIAITLAVVAAVCAFFMFRTVERHRTLVAFDEDGIALRGIKPKRLAWNEIDSMKLTYYAVRRSKKDSWMQLTLAAQGDMLKIDSRLDGFVEIVERAAEAARDNDVPLSRITQANLRALEIEDY